MEKLKRAAPLLAVGALVVGVTTFDIHRSITNNSVPVSAEQLQFLQQELEAARGRTGPSSSPNATHGASAGARTQHKPPELKLDLPPRVSGGGAGGESAPAEARPRKSRRRTQDDEYRPNDSPGTSGKSGKARHPAPLAHQGRLEPAAAEQDTHSEAERVPGNGSRAQKVDSNGGRCFHSIGGADEGAAMLRNQCGLGMVGAGAALAAEVLGCCATGPPGTGTRAAHSKAGHRAAAEGGSAVALIADTHGVLDEGTMDALRCCPGIGLILHAGDVADKQQRKSRLPGPELLHRLAQAVPGQRISVLAVAGNTDNAEVGRAGSSWAREHGSIVHVAPTLAPQSLAGSIEWGSVCEVKGRGCAAAVDELPGHILVQSSKGLRILLLHICGVPPEAEARALMVQWHPHVVVFGHSHVPHVSRDEHGTLYINPGSAGPRRFKLPRCWAVLHVGPCGGLLSVQFQSLSDEAATLPQDFQTHFTEVCGCEDHEGQPAST